jgi:hypothetical protein
VLQAVQCCGDYDRLMQGVYENFLNMSFRDSRLEAVSYINVVSSDLCVLCHFPQSLHTDSKTLELEHVCVVTVNA